MQFADGHAEAFDEVVLTMPSPAAAKLCPAIPAAEKVKLDGVQYQGIVCASVLLTKPLAGYYVTNLIDPWVPFTAVIEMTALVEQRPARSSATGIWCICRSTSTPPTRCSSSRTSRSARRSSRRCCGCTPHLSADDVLDFKISRVRRVLAIPTLHYSANLPAMATGLPGIRVINAAHIVNGTLNVDECVKLANEAASTLCSTGYESNR